MRIRLRTRRAGASRALPGLAAILLLAGAAPEAQAQTVHGRLLEARFDRPIPSAEVFLISETGDRVATATSATNGRFTLRTRRPGIYFIGAERIGYRTLMDGPIELQADAVAEVELRLPLEPIVLDPVTGRAERLVPHLQAAGFYDRRVRGSGHFITRDAIERRNPSQIQQLLRGVPGVRVFQTATGADGTGVIMGRAAGYEIDPETPPCFARVFVDGIPDQHGLGIRPMNIEAVEVYRGPGEMPIEYGGMTGCGAIVIWTRR